MGDGIAAGVVQGSEGRSTQRHGINDTTVLGCRGISSHTGGIGSHGINTSIASDSVGISSGGTGIRALNSVSNSHGSSTRQHLDAYGIHCDGKISDSEGSAWGSGIRARGNAGVVANSSGSSTHGHGIDANQVSASSGYASATGLHGIFAELVTHSRGVRAVDDGVNAGIHALRGVGSLAIKGEIIIEKFDMP